MRNDPLRPVYHFSPARNWMNDPNGLVRYDGEYHLFFQHNPDGVDWGNMSWGHAVSTDLAHWEELPVALRADELEHVFSGSVVHDRDNTSGLGTGDRGPLVAIYTGHDPVSHREAQALAFSVDRGRTWEKYAHNPVLDLGCADFRDPKVFWHEEDASWVMVVVLAAERVVRLYSSPDLRSWTLLSDFGPAGATEGVWECPDLFPLALDGDPARLRWVLVVSVQSGAPWGGSGMQYFVGDFDGLKFTAEHDEVAWLDHGADYYAAVTFNNLPGDRQVQIGWLGNWDYANSTPTSPWRGAQSIPRELTLTDVAGRPTLVQKPVVELNKILGKPGVQSVTGLTGQRTLGLRGTALDLDVTLTPHGTSDTGVVVRQGGAEGTRIGWSDGQIYVDRTDSGEDSFSPAFPRTQRVQVPLVDGQLRLRILVDRSSVEVFTRDGRVAITNLIYPDLSSDRIAAYSVGGTADVKVVARTVR